MEMMEEEEKSAEITTEKLLQPVAKNHVFLELSVKKRALI